MHGFMECPWKEPAVVEEADGGWVVTTMQHKSIKCFYTSSGLYDGRLVYSFNEDAGEAFLFQDKHHADLIALGANNRDTDIFCRLARPRTVKELTELREAAENRRTGECTGN